MQRRIPSLAFAALLAIALPSLSFAQSATPAAADATTTIEETVTFENTTPARLYQIYLSSSEHAAFTGFAANIDPVEGGLFQAFIDVPVQGAVGVSGKILTLDPGTHSPDTYIIVQTWRGYHDAPADSDSQLVLTIRKCEGGASIKLTHVNVPTYLADGVRESWDQRYWAPLRTYLQTNAASH